MYKLIIAGNVVRRPEGRDVSGVRCATFTVAVNYYAAKAKQSAFIRCTAWGKTAEKCEQFLDKGSSVICWGRPSVYAWNDKQDGGPRGSMELTCDEVEFTGRRSEVDNPVENAENTQMAEEDDDEMPF